MLFNSFVFIFLFLPLTLIGYFLLHGWGRHNAAKGLLIAASLYFYSYFNTSYLPIILASIAVNYAVAWYVMRRTGLRKLVFVQGILFNVGLLGYFKYTDFFIENVNAVFGQSFALKHILLPLGISFFTFQQLAFIVDAYGRKRELPSVLDYCNFVTFFPQLIAGPIVLPEEMLPQFADRANHRLVAKNIFDGLFIFSLGLAKKVLIADSIAGFANVGYSGVMDHFTMAEAWLIALSYTFQLYFDFSGYCDMAIGIGKMFNIDLPLNFNAPYRATGFQDFWRRWHITLNRFLTQYVYIPLGGSRQGNVYVNILIVFLISGFWHGAGWTFILWGVLHGVGVVVNRLWKRHGFEWPDWMAMGLTFVCVNVLWVLFRADSLPQAFRVIGCMFNNTQLGLTQAYTSNLPSILPNSVNMMILFAAMALGWLGPTAFEWMKTERMIGLKKVAMVAGFVVAILFITRVKTFLYFNF